MKIFHLGYLLLLDSLDMPDDEFGTRSARLLAQMRDQGYETSLDLVSRKGDPRYQPLVLPALRHLDYLVINELEAGEFSGLEMRDENDAPHIAHIADAAAQLLAAGVRQRVVIHCPEGAWGEARVKRVAGSRHGCWSRKRLSAASARAMPFARAFIRLP
jgi:sugar/nucleoside kinase (ribokinase family)